MATWKLTPDTGQVSGTNTDMPLVVIPSVLEMGAITLAQAQSSRFYSDAGLTTELAREVVSADEIHFKDPSVTSATEVWMTFDGVAADYAVTDTYGRNAVWSGSNIQGAWHMEGNSNDSTVTGNDGTDTSVTYNTPKIGQYFSVAASGYAALTDDAATQYTSSYTISFYVRTTATDFGTIYSQMSLVSTFKGISIRMNNTSPNKINWNHMHSTGDSGDMVSSGQINTGSWILVHCVYDTVANTRTIYFNGASDSSIAEASNATWLSPGSNFFRIGARKFNATAEGIPLNGDIEEVRASSEVRSANWITTEYNNQSDNAAFWVATEVTTGTSIKSIGGVTHANIKSMAGITID